MNSKINIFLLAGNRLLREALARILRAKGDICVVGVASYTPHAIDQVAESGCEVLLLDSITSVLSDCDFIRRVVEKVVSLKVILIGMEEDAAPFLRAVRAGAVGYVLKDASAMDVVHAVRLVAQDEVVCPPRLCGALFKYVSRDCSQLPNVRVQVQLGLTRRQQQLVPLIAQGLSNKEIAAHLNVSEQTVKNHVHEMLRRVGVRDRLAIVEMVRMQGSSVW